MICFDCDFDIRPIIPRMLEKGDQEIVVGRYISSNMHSWKVINVHEAAAIAEADARMKATDPTAYFKVWLIFEDDGKPRHAPTGHANARATRLWLSMLGAPQGALVAYTDDEDGPASPVLEATEAYFGGLQGADGKCTVTRGLYASGHVLYEAHAKKLIDVRWPTQSMGFTDSRKMVREGAYELRQLLNVTFCGRDVDPDVFHDGVTPEACGCFTPDPHPMVA